jgi:hypothetical protein
MTTETLIQAFASAIAHAEGFYVTGSIPQRANNPGDLTDDGDVGHGFIESSGPMGAKITVYGSVEDGWAALNKKVARMLNGASHVYPLSMTIMEVGLKYAGSAAWAQNVATKLGIDTRTTLAEYVSRLTGEQKANTV